MQIRFLICMNTSGSSFYNFLRNRNREYFTTLIINSCPCCWIWVQAAYKVEYFLSTLVPINFAVLFENFRGVKFKKRFKAKLKQFCISNYCKRIYIIKVKLLECQVLTDLRQKRKLRIIKSQKIQLEYLYSSMTGFYHCFWF